LLLVERDRLAAGEADDEGTRAGSAARPLPTVVRESVPAAQPLRAAAPARPPASEADDEGPRAGSPARPLPHVVGQRVPAAEQLAAADRQPPQAGVDRVGAALRRQREALALQVRALLLAREPELAHRREHVQVGRERRERGLE